MKEKWFAVEQMYRTLPLLDLSQPDKEWNGCGHGSFLYQHSIQQLISSRHNVPPSLEFEQSCLQTFLPLRPLDIFLIHTGAQKLVEVDTMEDIFTSSGFQCFFDYDMEPSRRSPVDTMKFALESCRHSVVVLSKAFMTRRAPCAELMYAFQRMEWLRRHGMWESLWIILYDISVPEYYAAFREALFPLPDIGSGIVLLEYAAGKGKFARWSHLCHSLKAHIVKVDREHAIDQWRKLLTDWESLEEREFPKADTVYPLKNQSEHNLKKRSRQSF